MTRGTLLSPHWMFVWKPVSKIMVRTAPYDNIKHVISAKNSKPGLHPGDLHFNSSFSLHPAVLWLTTLSLAWLWFTGRLMPCEVCEWQATPTDNINNHIKPTHGPATSISGEHWLQVGSLATFCSKHLDLWPIHIKGSHQCKNVPKLGQCPTLPDPPVICGQYGIQREVDTLFIL